MRYLLFVVLLFSGGVWAVDNPYNRVQSVEADFAEVRMFLEMAITDRGMVINNVAHIGNMLERTAADIPGAKPIYRHAEALEFCSALISRAMMEADPHNISYCPYIIAVYELVEQPGTVYLSYRRPALPADASEASREAMDRVEALLADIVADTL